MNRSSSAVGAGVHKLEREQQELGAGEDTQLEPGLLPPRAIHTSDRGTSATQAPNFAGAFRAVNFCQATTLADCNHLSAYELLGTQERSKARSACSSWGPSLRNPEVGLIGFGWGLGRSMAHQTAGSIGTQDAPVG